MNVGDSSMLELADGRLVQLSTDDALIGRASLPGLPSAVVIPTRGGGRALIEVVPLVHTDDGSGRRRLLLCTDGLTNFVARHDIADILRSGGS